MTNPTPKATDGWRAIACGAFDSALAAGHPAKITARAVGDMPTPATAVIAIGKAAAAMALAARQCGNLLADCPGVVVTNDENYAEIPGLECFASSHPVPDERGLKASAAVRALAQRLGAEDHLLLLVSGGGSALVPAPASGISLAEKARLNEALLASGMDIHQMNVVRRLFSALKGGRLARLAYPAKLTQFLLSDVPGDRLESIASGPAVADPTPLTEAHDLITRYRLDQLDFVTRHMAAIASGEADQPVRPGDPEMANVTSQILASNGICQQAAAQTLAPQAGTALDDMPELEGDAAECGARLARKIIAESQHRDGMFFGVSGGETIVALGDGPTGKGGRSQELALGFALAMAKAEKAPGKWLVLAGGTDGRDGPTDAAGAVITSCCDLDLDAARQALLVHDAYPFLKAHGLLLQVPPTGTNLGDLVIVMASA